jgi:predicted HD phosphohydrolase
MPVSFTHPRFAYVRFRIVSGPMDETEARIFESDALFEENVQMRRWDEGAKVDGLICP